jgi:uncharacterized coiled-coil protein SlyX
MNGVRSIWGLLGFIEKIRTNRRLNKLEEAVSSQTETVDKLSKEIAKHSIIINQLQVSTQDLHNKIQDLTNRVESLERRVSAVETELKIQQVLEIIDSLISRAEEALDYGFTKLENIIHMSLIGQTSAFLLPPEKLQEVQNQLNKDSTAIIDSDYKHMKSIIVSDPDKQHSVLLAVINVVALSRKSKELLKLIPMPLYQGSMTLQPKLDYTAVVLDQEAGTYTIVEPDELTSCLNDHCVTSNPETNIAAQSCGVPQYFDRQIDICDFEEVVSEGVFLRRLQLDGIVFNVREEVSAQIFCANNAQSKAHKIKNSGIVNLPPGCIFSVTDKTGRIMKIKSLPVAQMIEFQPVDIIVAGPDQIFRQEGASHLLNGTSGLTKIINAHLSSLSAQLDNNSDTLHSQWKYVIILASLLGVTLALSLVIGGLLYRYSSRFRQKVISIKTELKEGLEQASQRLHLTDSKGIKPDSFILVPGQRSPPPIPPQSLKTLLHKLEKLEERILQSEAYLNLLDEKGEAVYHSTSDPHYTATPTARQKLYPSSLLSSEDLEQSQRFLFAQGAAGPTAPKTSSVT